MLNINNLLNNQILFKFVIYIDNCKYINNIFYKLFEYINYYYDEQFTIKLCYNKKNTLQLLFYIKFLDIKNKNFDYYIFKEDLQKDISSCLQNYLWKSEDTSDEEHNINLYLIHPFEIINYTKYLFNYNLSSI